MRIELFDVGFVCVFCANVDVWEVSEGAAEVRERLIECNRALCKA